MISLCYFETSVTAVTITQRNVPEEQKPRHVNNRQLNYCQVCLSAETRNIAVVYSQLTVCGATNRHTEWVVGRFPLEVGLKNHSCKASRVRLSGAKHLIPLRKPSTHIQEMIYLYFYKG